MRGLSKILPPFSTDISGACSALFDLGGIVVVHEPACCTSCFTTFDEPRYYGSTSPLYSSELREIHLSTGDDETLIRRVEAASEIMDCRFIAIIGSPLSLFAGTDYEALASELEGRTGVPSFSVDTGGFDWYERGVSKALLELVKKFVPNPRAASARPRRDKPFINIIGATPMDGIRIKGAGGLIEHYSRRGYSINAVLSEGSSIEEISGTAEGDLNIVISASGLETAEYLEKEFGIPYSCGVPIGEEDRIEAELYAPVGKVLIIGDQIVSNSLRDCLSNDFGIREIRVSSFFSMNPTLSREKDIELRDEDALRDLLEKESFDLMIGDPVFSGFIRYTRGLRHIPLPHIAVSGYSPFERRPNLVGHGGYLFLKEALETLI